MTRRGRRAGIAGGGGRAPPAAVRAGAARRARARPALDLEPRRRRAVAHDRRRDLGRDPQRVAGPAGRPRRPAGALAGDPGFRAALDRLAGARRAYLRDPATWCAGAAPDLATSWSRTSAWSSASARRCRCTPAGSASSPATTSRPRATSACRWSASASCSRRATSGSGSIAAGWQAEAYPYNDPTTLPILPVDTADGARLRIPLAIAGRTVWLRAWVAQVGRVPLYLLDANDPLNGPVDRGITTKLYGGGPDARLLQDLILGVGGWRLLEALGLEPTVAHLNEGHAAFVVVERARAFMRRARASASTRRCGRPAPATCSRPTPRSPAGFDRFDADRVERYLRRRRRPADRRSTECSRSAGAIPADGARAVRHGVPGDAWLGPDQRRQPAARRGQPRACSPTCSRAGPNARCRSATSPTASTSRRGTRVPPTSCGRRPAARTAGAARRRGLEPTAVDPAATSDCGRCAASSAATWSSTRAGGWPRSSPRGAGPRPARVGRPASSIPAALTLGFARRFAEYKRPNLLLREPERLARLLVDPRAAGAARGRGQGPPRRRRGQGADRGVDPVRRARGPAPPGRLPRGLRHRAGRGA